MRAASKRLPTVELVVLTAGLMSLNALAIDVMLPALPAMGEALGVAAENDRQLVVVAYVLGMGVGQLFFGPLSDRFGRRPVLLASLIAYSAFGVACAIPGSFGQLVAFRAAQGVAAAGARVVSISLVRDLFVGAQMARIMSWVTIVFMAVPILAPSLGWVILQLADWRAIFWTLVAMGLALSVWVVVRLPETLEPQLRRSIKPRALAAGYWEVVKNPHSRAYALGAGFMFGSLFSFISASEQIFRAYDRVDSFPLYFAGVAGAMSVASFLNASFVERFGTRTLSHGALLAFAAVQVVYASLFAAGATGLGVFYLFLLLSFFAFGWVGANFNAMAMAPLGHVAGTASAAVGFTSSTLAGMLGGLIARQFDGTPLPISLGFLGLAVTTIVLVNLSVPRPAVSGEPARARP